MQAACEAGEVFALLEGGCGGAREAAECLAALFHASREPWLVRALLHYHARSGSSRALELLARAPDHHARHLLDALLEQLRGGDRAARRHALGALAPLVARRPAWLHLVGAHGVCRELVRSARTEREPAPRLHALLALAALMGAAPGAAGAHAQELAEAAARCGSSSEPHAALAARALFRAVYAAAPVAAVEALRACGAEAATTGGQGARDAWERALSALARGVPLHPALVTGWRGGEQGSRWPHAALPPPPAPRDTPPPSAAADPSRLWRHSPAPPPGSTAQAARAAGALRPGGDGWFALGERSGAESAPHTPLPAEPDHAEPEPAVEATPENTPARPAAAAFRFPADGGAARALLHTTAPAGDAYAARLARVAAERRANDSPVPFGGAPPAAATRPEPRAPRVDRPPSEEDREVTALTASAPPPSEWDAPPDPAPDPRAAAPRRHTGAAAPPPRRALSAPPRVARRADAAVQTVDVWPEPYDFLLADFYRTLPDDATDQAPESTERLDAYLTELYSGRGGAAQAAGGGELAEQLALAHAQLMYERWRREAHAERNRRLLGRCRRLHALELHNAALAERVRALTRELDALRDRAPMPPAPLALPPSVEMGAREAQLEAALERERVARLRAEAAAREAEAHRARDAAELQRTRADSFEAARHVEALARAAFAAERRAELVRRLRRELLVLGEREARLRAAAEAGAADSCGGTDEVGAALRAACARAEAEAGVASARAEAACARAHELEAAVSARDAAVSDLKRATRAAAEEGAARARALQDKYAALQAVLRAKETRRLHELAAAH